MWNFLDNILDLFGIDLGNEVVDVPENREVRNVAGIEYTEGEFERIDEVSNVMRDVFSDEVVSNWENYSLEERTQLLSEYYTRCGEVLGIDTKMIVVDDLYAAVGEGVVGCNTGDGNLYIDYRALQDPSQLWELLDTTTHEMRHQFQYEAFMHPEKYPDIPQETLDAWEYNWASENYISGNDDPEGYYNQPIEVDARSFAEEVLAEYTEPRTAAYAMVPGEATEGDMIVADGEEASLLAASAGDAPGDGEVVDQPVGAEVPLAEGLEADSDLNVAASYTPAQCAKVSSGTQNYCLFAGSGR